MCWCSPGTDKEITSNKDRFPYLGFILCSSSAEISLLGKNFLRSDFSRCGIMAVRDCNLLVFHGHLLQETEGPVKHKLYHGSSKFSTTNFSQVTSCRKPSGKLCLVKSLGCERCEIHRSITLRQDLRSLTARARGRL